MTDKIKKLEQLTEDVQPEFPTLSRGGYVEDAVDDWLSNHLREVNQIIEYQNYSVDVIDGLEGELEAATTRISELEAVSDSSVQDNLRAELAAARAELAAATAKITELENTSMVAFPTHESETVQASILLQHATKLGAEYIEKAKADGEQIRHDAEEQLVELRGEIENLEAQRFATFRSLEDFYARELATLRENNVFAHETGNVVIPESAEPAVEEGTDTTPDAEVTTPVADPAVETEEEATVEEDEPALLVEDETVPSIDEDDEVELETNELLDEDEESEGNSK